MVPTYAPSSAYNLRKFLSHLICLPRWKCANAGISNTGFSAAPGKVLLHLGDLAPEFDYDFTDGSQRWWWTIHVRSNQTTHAPRCKYTPFVGERARRRFKFPLMVTGACLYVIFEIRSNQISNLILGKEEICCFFLYSFIEREKRKCANIWPVWPNFN